MGDHRVAKWNLLTDDEKLLAKQDYEAGKTLQEIATQLGCSKGQIRSTLLKQGVVLRPSGFQEKPDTTRRDDPSEYEILMMAREIRRCRIA